MERAEHEEALVFFRAAARITSTTAASDALQELVLKKVAVTAKTLHGDASSEHQAAASELDKFRTQIKVRPAPASAPVDVRHVSLQSPLGARCWSQKCVARSAALRVCGRCRVALYCSRECQVDGALLGARLRRHAT